VLSVKSILKGAKNFSSVVNVATANTTVDYTSKGFLNTPLITLTPLVNGPYLAVVTSNTNNIANVSVFDSTTGAIANNILVNFRAEGV